MGTVVVGIIVAGVVALAVRSMVRDKKNRSRARYDVGLKNRLD